MLQELSMVEQRYLAVREVLDTGADVNDVATRYGVNRRTLHRWLTRYANAGLGASPIAAVAPIGARCRSRRWSKRASSRFDEPILAGVPARS